MTSHMQNGLTPREGQPVKSIINYAAEIIAVCASTASASGTFALTSAAIALQVVLMRLGGALQ